MRKFIVRRAIGSILALLAAALLVFSASRLLSDPKYLLLPEQGRKGIDEEVWNRMADELHLNDPIPIQFGYWLWDLAHGDLGTDLQDGLPLAPKLKKKIHPVD
jgi:peptide/nickel transport system permease protein